MADTSVRSNQVQFIRLGYDIPVSYATYKDYVEQYTGALVFAKVQEKTANPSTNETGNVDVFVDIPTYYINAYGIEYKVANSDVLTYVYNQLNDVTTDEDGKYTNQNSVHYWIQEAITEAELTAEKVYKVIDASNKEHLTDIEVLSVNDRKGLEADAEPVEEDTEEFEELRSNLIWASAAGIDTSVVTRTIESEGEDGDASTATTTSSLLFGIDLDKIYLPQGVHRTEAIGVHPESEDVLLEGVGFSVKELLEYYLVKEKWPTRTTILGAGAFGAFSVNVANMPKSITEYVSLTNNSVSVVGTKVTIDTIAGGLALTENGEWATEKTSSQAQISNIKYGYSETTEGDPTEDSHITPKTVKKETSVTADSTKQEVTYTRSYGSAGTPDVSTTIKITTEHVDLDGKKTNYGNLTNTSIGTKEYELKGTDAPLKEGTYTIMLEFNHDVSAIRDWKDDEQVEIPGIDTIYPLSNKKHIAEDVSTKVAASKFTKTDSASVNSYAKTSMTLYAVYPIYTNGNPNGGKPYELTNTDIEFAYYNNTYVNNPVQDGSISVEGLYELPITNYITKVPELYLDFGDAQFSEKKWVIYLPSHLKLQNNLAYPYTVAGTTLKITEQPVTFDKSEVYLKVNGDAIKYNKYETADTFKMGASAVKFTLSK